MIVKWLFENKHTVITGLNGTGKSTLIGLMSGIYFPMEGSVKAFCKILHDFVTILGCVQGGMCLE